MLILKNFKINLIKILDFVGPHQQSLMVSQNVIDYCLMNHLSDSSQRKCLQAAWSTDFYELGTSISSSWNSFDTAFKFLFFCLVLTVLFLVWVFYGQCVFYWWTPYFFILIFLNVHCIWIFWFFLIWIIISTVDLLLQAFIFNFLIFVFLKILK